MYAPSLMLLMITVAVAELIACIFRQSLSIVLDLGIHIFKLAVKVSSSASNSQP